MDKIEITVLVISMLIVGFVMGGACGLKWSRDDAIKAGVGKWIIPDPTEPRTEFVFITNNIPK